MKIRMAVAQDVAEILAIYAPYCSTPISFELQPPTIAELESRLTHTLSGGYPWLVAVEEEKIIGYAYGHAFRDRPAYRWSVETSVYVDQNAHGKGVGAALYKQLLAMLKAQGFVSAMAGITLPNAASEKLHKNFGFKPVGACENIGFKCDTWHDVGFFELQLNPPVKSPREPLPLSEVARMIPA